MSDYARVALCRLLGAAREAGGNGLEAKVLELDGQMQALQGELRRLQGMVGQRPEAAARASAQR